MPSNMFKSTSIPVVCMILKKCVQAKGVFMIDASDLCVKKNKKNELRPQDIETIMDYYIHKKASQISKMLDLKTIKIIIII